MAKKKSKVAPLTLVAVVVDESGSMSGLTAAAMASANQMLESVRASTAGGHEAHVCVVGFSNAARVVLPLTDARRAAALTRYGASGGTALFDGLALAVDTLRASPVAADPDTSFLAVVVTDGEENSSVVCPPHRAKALLAELNASGRWTVAFNVPRGGYRDRLAAQFGVPPENIREWEQTVRGVEETTVHTRSAIGNYFGARKAGLRSVENFYTVTTDLSKVTPTKVKRTLTDISARFKAYTVPAEAPLKEFVEAKTKRPYVIGSAYYQLMKPELVRGDRALLLMKKGEKAVYGGAQARDLVGLPTDGSDAKVTPGNCGDWDVFAESRSVNRKLPRGTRVLVDTAAAAGKLPTWDHTAVATGS